MISATEFTNQRSRQLKNIVGGASSEQHRIVKSLIAGFTERNLRPGKHPNDWKNIQVIGITSGLP